MRPRERKMKYLMTAMVISALCVPALHAKGKPEKGEPTAVKAELKEKATAFFTQQKEQLKKFNEEMKAKREALNKQLDKEAEAFVAKNPELKELVEKRLEKRKRRMEKRKDRMEKRKERMESRKGKRKKGKHGDEEDLP